MWGGIALLCGLLFVTWQIRKRNDIVKRMNEGPMFGFHWGDSVKTVATWCGRIGLKYHSADNATATVTYIGRFPGAIPRATYSFYLPGAALDSLAILMMDPGRYTYNTLRTRFCMKFGEAWDEDENDTSWLTKEMLVVLMQGESGFLHVRFLNRANVRKGKTIEDEHDAVLEGLQAIDAELKRQNEERK